MEVYLTNGRVAWQVPRGRIAKFYDGNVYQCPEGWHVVPEDVVKDWQTGEVGEQRNPLSNIPSAIS